MIKKLCTLLALLFCLNAQAQFTKTDGPIAECKEKFDLQSVIGADNNAFYVFRKDEGGNMFVQRYNKKTFAKEWETNVSLKQKSLQVEKWDTKALGYLKGNQIYLYIPAADNDNKRAVLLLTTIGTDGKIISEAKEIGSLNEHFTANKRVDVNCKFICQLSPDSSKIIFCLKYYATNLISTIDLKNLKAIPKVLNDTCKTMAGLRVSLLNSFAIDNDGKLAYSYLSGFDKLAPTATVLRVNIYDPATKTEKTYIPNFQGADKYVLQNSKLSFVKKGKLMFTAIITDYTKQKGQKKNPSILIAQIDANSGKADYETTQYFSEEWRVKYDPAKRAGNGEEWGGSDYDFDFTLVNDGGYIISAYRKGGWNCSTKNVDRELDDAVITKINSNGKIEWIKMMPIKEVTEFVLNKNGLKTAYVNSFYLNNRMYYIFNDHKKNETNIDLTKVESSESTKIADDPRDSDVNTTCISIDMSGKMQRNTVQVHKDLGFYPLDKNVWIDKNKLLLYYSNGGKESFSTLTIQ